MAVEAPVSKFKKNNVKIFIVVLLVFAGWFTYDGHLNETFKEEHTTKAGPDDTLVFNQKAPPYLAAAAVILSIYLLVINKKKITADETQLVLGSGKTISYEAIEKIDKTNFDSKGYFVITYKEPSGSEADLKINKRKYDNLAAVLDELVAKIS